MRDALGRKPYDGAACDGAALPPLGPGRFILVVSDGPGSAALLLTVR